jgi:hypothetical protein
MYLPHDWAVNQVVTNPVPIAWPFGDQLFLLLEKSSVSIATQKHNRS